MKISILLDNQDSWILPWIEDLSDALIFREHSVTLYHQIDDLQKGDIAFFLSCNRIVPEELLLLHKHNLVCHPSDLPEGRGHSPLAWQVLEGKSEIFISLFEAVKEVDSGPIYLQDKIILKGHELNDEIKYRQGKCTKELCLKFIELYPNNRPLIPNKSSSTYYKKRTKESSELDIKKSIESQFNLMRVADNARYPLYFRKDGYKYMLEIKKSEEI